MLGASLLFAGLAAGATPSKEPISQLFVQSAPEGTFKPVQGRHNRFVLRLHDPPPQIVWFSDRPARHQGQIPIRGFVRTWEGFGFVADRPNAALTLVHHDNSEDTVVVELGKPRYHGARNVMTYHARKLPHATGNLSDFERDRDGHVPRHFRGASLFIDDSSQTVVNGCVIQPYTNCSGANLAGAYLVDADLEEADLEETNFAGVNFTNAYVVGASMQFANLTHTTLDDANFFGAQMRAVDLTGAHLNDVTQLGTLCHTTMPDGSDSGC